MPKYITKPRVLKMLDQIVKDFGPDHTVAYCSYADPADRQKPCCIVGQFLYRLNPAILEEINNRGMNAAEPLTLVREGVLEGFTLTKPAVEALTIAQRVQDGRSKIYDRTWGAAVREAKTQA